MRQYQHLRSKRVRVVPLVRLRLLPSGPGGSASIGDGELLDALQPTRLRLVEKSGEDLLVDRGEWEELVGTLRDDWKRLVQLRFWEDQSCRQIARQEGRSQRTVNRMLHSALEQIRHDLDEEREAV